MIWKAFLRVFISFTSGVVAAFGMSTLSEFSKEELRDNWQAHLEQSKASARQAMVARQQALEVDLARMQGDSSDK